MNENEVIERRACISGVGQSDVGRRLFRDPLELTLDACLAAIDHAGLTVHDIDGLSTYPGPVGFGISEGGVTAVEEALRLKPTWTNGGMDLPGPGGSLIAAMLAVSAGLCRHVLCFRTVWEATFSALQMQQMAKRFESGGGGGPSRVSGAMQAFQAASSAAGRSWLCSNTRSITACVRSVGRFEKKA